jgi:uncharacterized protein (DUF2252 family)
VASTAVLTPRERESAGKQARSHSPRSRHREWQTGESRPDPVDTLLEQDKTRVPALVPIRHGRMLASPFSFYRGAAAIMAADLASCPSSGLRVQLCGDAHLSNFGIFMAPDRRLIFDINDFDETHEGPFEWDVKRLAASFAVAGRALGLKSSRRRTAIDAAVAGYRNEIRRLAGMRDLDVWYARVDVDALSQVVSEMSAKRGKALAKGVAKAERKDSLRAFAKLTRTDGKKVSIRSDPPLIMPLDELIQDGDDPSRIEAHIRGLLDAYRKTLSPDVRQLLDRYRYVDLAHKVVGVGSVGTRCWIVLMLGRDTDDPLFLQVKEADPSVLEPFAGRTPYRHQGRRVVEGQRLMQAASDIMLGWISAEGVIDGKPRDFYVRQLWDGKGSAEIEKMNAKSLQLYAKLCGQTLAHGHARSGDRIAIASYLGGGDGFDTAICDFAHAYADQNERDYAEFSAAVDSGRIEARTGL